MAGSHNATTPYRTITIKGVGWVVGFCCGFSLGPFCRIWLAPPIPCILLPDSLHTYRKCLKAFNHGWQYNATTPYHTITLEGVGTVVGFCCGFSLGTCCRIWLGSPIHFILLLDSLYTYIMCFSVFYCGWQSYSLRSRSSSWFVSIFLW